MKTHTRSSLFLLELIVAILFFALSAVVCIQLFVYSDGLGNESEDRNLAVTQGQRVVESFYGDNSELENIVTKFEFTEVAEGEYVSYYGNDGEFTENGEEPFKVVLTSSEEENLELITINILYNDKTDAEAIFEISTKKYLPKQLGGI